jgi:glyoxylate/hydroxypyruvate reductase
MALLLTPLGNPGEWLRVFAKEMPDLQIRVWPELGNPAEIEVAAISQLPPGTLASLPNLRLICSLMAGQEGLLSDPKLPRHVPIARSADPNGDAMMNETALLHVLRHHRFLPDYALTQARREWKPLARLKAGERKVGVLGLGMIGLAVARVLQRHGFEVAGWARSPRKLDGIATFHGRDQLAAFLGRSEIVVNLLALTRETSDFLCAETFAMLPKGAAVINLARGQHVVDADLIAALDGGQLSAATLDVFRIEPLPKESPLWAHPRITIMPHVARRIDPTVVVPAVCDQIRRLHQGEPPVHLVDRDAGY